MCVDICVDWKHWPHGWDGNSRFMLPRWGALQEHLSDTEPASQMISTLNLMISPERSFFGRSFSIQPNWLQANSTHPKGDVSESLFCTLRTLLIPWRSVKFLFLSTHPIMKYFKRIFSFKVSLFCFYVSPNFLLWACITLVIRGGKGNTDIFLNVHYSWSMVIS